MGKIKKKYKKKINPEQSNKMIYAVVAGLVILIIVFLIFTLSGEKVMDKNQLMTETLKYLKTTEGISELKILSEENKIIIVYDQYIKKNKKMDFQKIARYAGLKLSNKLENEELTILLCEDKEEKKVYSVVLNNGRIVSEKLLR